jgi:hypothetical protein
MQPYMQAAPVAAPTGAAQLSSAPQVAPQSAPNSTIPHEVGGASRSAPSTGGHGNGSDKASLVSCSGRHTRVSSSGMCEQKKEAHRHRAWGWSRSAPTWGGCHALLSRGGGVTLCSYVGGGCHTLLLRVGGVSRSAPTTGGHVRCQSRALRSYPRSAWLRAHAPLSYKGTCPPVVGAERDTPPTRRRGGRCARIPAVPV